MFDDLDKLNQGGQDDQGNMGQNKKASFPPSLEKKMPSSPPPMQDNEVEDMFGETERKKPSVFEPRETITGNNQFVKNDIGMMDQGQTSGNSDKNKVIVLVLMILSLVVVVILAWYAYKIFFNSLEGKMNDPINQSTNVNNQQNNDPESNNPSNNSTNNTFQGNNSTTNNNQVSKDLDSDDDGLTDEEEKALGTNYLSPDSDGDGLFDKEEVEVYKTDPMNKDTDGDKYEDGSEVQSGYNPNGEGRLYSLEDNK